jgi:hypothetical protein
MGWDKLFETWVGTNCLKYVLSQMKYIPKLCVPTSNIFQICVVPKKNGLVSKQLYISSQKCWGDKCNKAGGDRCNKAGGDRCNKTVIILDQTVV